MNPYEVLGVARNASAEEIKKAYRTAAMKNHPDRNPGDKQAEERFKEAARAYEILSNPSRRDAYDRFGTTGEPGAGGMGGMEDVFGGFGLDDALRAFMENFGFASGGRSRTVVQGEDLTVKVDLDLNEAALGGRREIKVEKNTACECCDGSGADPDAGMETCRQCDGTGRIASTRNTLLGSFRTVKQCPVCRGAGKVPKKMCRECGGKGYRKKKTSIAVELPAGLSRGHYIRLRGQGNHPGMGGVPGDLRLLVNNVNYGPFQREDDDLVFPLVISYSAAVLGDEFSIPSPDGEEVRIKVPSGTQAGTRIHHRNMGMGRLNRRGRGDLIAEIQIFVPSKVKKKDKELLKKLEESSSFSIRKK
ncbi:molecular chaperone DnaJ [Candidatus Fermentibacteria bacterium]|nr:MAG: molecular chaperone DnaJ [Candidatus Fermentibacteria bacterium]